MPTIEIKTVPISNGFTAKVLLQLPPNMDRSGKTKYPMLVDVYGGPDSYSVRNYTYIHIYYILLFNLQILLRLLTNGSLTGAPIYRQINL